MATSKLLVLAALGFACSCVPVKCAKILGVFPFPATSHYILGNALMKGLAAAGHDVTMVSPFEEKNPPKNGSYRNIVITEFANYFENMRKDMNFFGNDHRSPFAVLFMQSLFQPITENTFTHPEFKALLDSKEKFDAVIIEQFSNDAMKVFSYHFGVPLIVLSTLGPNAWINHVVGNPSPPSCVPHMLASFPVNMTFFQRVYNLIYTACDYVFNHVYIFPANRNIVKKYFPDAPEFSDIYHNVSLVLLNSHESLYQAVPLVPNMIEIGGYHVAPPKKLPKDLQDYLDGAKEGVVYFSMGSNLRSKELPSEKRDIFLRVFSKLKEKVLWKWEDDVLPGQPPNVKLGKWFPQQDILAHPNVKLFITHGGLLSTTEAVYHGVPTLAIPVFGDQHTNARTAVNNGYAESIPYQDPNFSEERLSYLLNELLNNPKYRENINRRSKLFHDRPIKPMETAVYWVEYVIRHRGAPHLKIAGVEMPLYQYLLLDVIAFLVAVVVTSLYLLKLGVCLFVRRRTQSKAQKVKTN